MDADVDELMPENLVQIMLSSPRNWSLVSKLLTKILSARGSEERARQNLAVL